MGGGGVFLMLPPNFRSELHLFHGHALSIIIKQNWWQCGALIFVSEINSIYILFCSH